MKSLFICMIVRARIFVEMFRAMVLLLDGNLENVADALRRMALFGGKIRFLTALYSDALTLPAVVFDLS